MYILISFLCLTNVYFRGFSWRSKEGRSRKAQKACGVSVAQAPCGDVATSGYSLTDAEIKWSRKVPFGAAEDLKRIQKLMSIDFSLKNVFYI